MPELPEVEAIKKSLKPLIGLKIHDVRIYSPSLRYPIPIDLKQRIIGKYLHNILRKGKYMFWDFEGCIMTSHLGMTGKFTLQDQYSATKHDHIVWMFFNPSNIKINLVYNDPRRFGYIRINKSIQESMDKLNLGPDALSKDFSYQYFAQTVKNSNRNIKTILLDQLFVAGIGNIYASESLWYAEISPFRKANSLNKSEVTRLIKSIKSVLQKSISANGTTLKDYQTANGEQGMYHNNFVAYSLANSLCQKPKCPGKIIKAITNGRASYYCNNHQH